MVRAFKIKVPASSANIGPGYDVLGVGLSLFLELDVTIDSSQAQETNDDPNNCKLSYTKESEGYSTVPLRSDANLITRTALYVLRCNNIRNFPPEPKFTSPTQSHLAADWVPLVQQLWQVLF